MKYGCIGEHLKHSFSKEIHALLADYEYDICEVAKERLKDFMTERNFEGINVTIPYKGDVIPYLSVISDVAKEIGAVNTIVNRQGALYGYNTDFYGLRSLIMRIGASLKGKKVAILGTGGTSKTAHAVARDLGAREILCVSRSPREGCITYEELKESHRDITFLINTTPCGMFPQSETQALELSDFTELCGVVDAVYNPLRTNLILEAKEMGIPAVGGLYMLVAQAVRASEFFLGTEYPMKTLDRVYEKIRMSKENIVLIGMPGSGKSSVGKILAEQMKKEFLDIDECIVRRAGKSIPAIFSEDGEVAFRDIESRVIQEELADRNGLIIATGGGAILRKENVKRLRRNGRLYFLDRPLKELLPTEDRPLAQTAEAIQKRYEERYDLYLAAADRCIDVQGNAEWVSAEIRKDFEEE